jgi:hypothetical protein
MPRLDSPWLIAATSTALASALALSLPPTSFGSTHADEVSRVTRSPERTAVAFADALIDGQRRLALALSTGDARRRLTAGELLRPLPSGEVFIEELERLSDGRALVVAATELSARDAGLVERALHIVLLERDKRWSVDEIGWADGD